MTEMDELPFEDYPDEDEYDFCYECRGYGDDYTFDDNGELVCRCDDCPYNERYNND